MALIELPGVDDRDPHAIHFVEHGPERTDGSPQHRGKGDIEIKAFFEQQLAGRMGLGTAFFGEVNIGPAGEPILEIPLAFAVA